MHFRSNVQGSDFDYLVQFADEEPEIAAISKGTRSRPKRSVATHRKVEKRHVAFATAPKFLLPVRIYLSLLYSFKINKNYAGGIILIY